MDERTKRLMTIDPEEVAIFKSLRCQKCGGIGYVKTDYCDCMIGCDFRKMGAVPQEKRWGANA
jgi:hypothetical protein